MLVCVPVCLSTFISYSSLQQGQCAQFVVSLQPAQLAPLHQPSFLCPLCPCKRACVRCGTSSSGSGILSHAGYIPTGEEYKRSKPCYCACRIHANDAPLSYTSHTQEHRVDSVSQDSLQPLHCQPIKSSCTLALPSNPRSTASSIETALRPSFSLPPFHIDTPNPVSRSASATFGSLPNPLLLPLTRPP